MRCPGPRPSRLCTRTWPLATVPVSDPSTYVPLGRRRKAEYGRASAKQAIDDEKTNKTQFLDPPCRRAREVRRCQAPLHQAAPFQEPGLPPASPCPQDQHQEDLLRDPAIHFRLSILLRCTRRWCLIWFPALVWRKGGVMRSGCGASGSDGRHGALVEKYTRSKRKQKTKGLLVRKNGFSSRCSFRDQRLVISIFCSNGNEQKIRNERNPNKLQPKGHRCPGVHLWHRAKVGFHLRCSLQTEMRRTLSSFGEHLRSTW